MNTIHATETSATGYENEPRWNGPRTKRSRYSTRNRMGIPCETAVRIRRPIRMQYCEGEGGKRT